MASVGNPNTGFEPGQMPLYDDVNHQVVAARAKNVGTDSTASPNITYGDVSVTVNSGTVGVQGLNPSGTAESWQSNQDNIALLASAAQTTTQTVADQTNVNGRGVIVVLDMTVVGTGSVTLEIDGKDPVSGKYYAILTGAAVTTNSTNVYRVYPGLTAAANATANDVLPRTWRVKVTANNSNSATYSVGAMVML